MDGRRGLDSNLSGPRLAGRPRIAGPRADEEPFDPTNGACFNCGDKVGVMEFVLARNFQAAGHWRLCGPCWEWGNVRDPRDTDPLTA